VLIFENIQDKIFFFLESVEGRNEVILLSFLIVLNTYVRMCVWDYWLRFI